MRGKRAKPRKLEKDSIYHSELVTKLTNYSMLHGKKNIARANVLKAMTYLSEQTKEKPLEALEKSVDNLKPKVEVRSRRVGGANYQVPVPVREERQLSLALRWLIDAARARRKKTSFGIALGEELKDAFDGVGAAMKKKEDAHKMAEANKAFSHFQW